MRTGHGTTAPGTLIGGSGLKLPTAYTPTITWPGNTITTAAATYIHQPGLLIVWGSFTETVGVAGAAVTVSLPVGFTVALPGGATPRCGELYILTTITTLIALFGITNGSTNIVTQSTPAGQVSSGWVFEAHVPVSN